MTVINISVHKINILKTKETKNECNTCICKMDGQ